MAYEIRIGLASCGIAAGALEVWDELEKIAGEKGIKLKPVGCAGMCYAEPMIEVVEPDGKSFIYGGVSPEKAKKIVEEHILSGKPVREWVVKTTEFETPDEPYYKKQFRIATRNSGIINPESIDDYIAVGGYNAIEKVLKEWRPEEVIEAITRSGLRGRGGAGFPTGKKWALARKASSDKKYVICNGDEGDPGAFMDRNLLEGDPHSVMEGMMIAGYAIGADEGIFYVRAEYPLALKRLRIAIRQAEEKGIIGKDIFGTNFSFEFKIKEGAGAFVCGEETALMASIEGKRGMPRLRPPFPVEAGLWGKPTNINNVETYANVPWIILNGWEKFASMGTAGSKGTKVFALAGKVRRTGTVEVPMGITINEIVNEIGGGVKEGKKFKAVQLGGPSGGCLPATLGTIPIDYESLTASGAIMGSGGLIVMDDSTCMVDVARYFLSFTQNESCGKCTFCRIGTKRMLEVLTRICEGKGRDGDIELLETLGNQIKSASLCGLGQTAPNPVLTTIRYFRDEYEAHIKEHRCPAGVCKALIKYYIIPENCTGCHLCAKVCPVNAISGKVKEIHSIDPEICTRCGACIEVCKFDAIVKK